MTSSYTARFLLVSLTFLAFLLPSLPCYAESQENRYEGITDPFGEPADYEFLEDEKADKEFFHLGRFLMLGIDMGAGIYTGGLGKTTSPGFYFGGRLVYFFDAQLAMEVAVHFSKQTDLIQPDTNNLLELESQLIPLTVGARYYFDTKSAPRAIAAANPYLALGGGAYLKNETVTRAVGLSANDTNTNQFGLYAGAGVEFPFYRKHMYLGLDIRYHLVFFVEGEPLAGTEEGSRSGDYFTPVLTFTYNF